MRRHALGIVAIVLVAVGVLGQGQMDDAVTGTCLRIGGVLAILWLAWPQLQRVPIWAVGMLGVALFIVLRLPKLLWALLPLALLIWLLWPRRPRQRSGIGDPRD